MNAFEQKAEALNMLRQRYLVHCAELAEIEPRLNQYFVGLTDDVFSHDADPRDPQPLHNMSELLCGLRFLRLLETYESDRETLLDVIYKYEGRWEEVDGRWSHIEGGVRHPGNNGPTYYRLQPFQVFVLASMFLLKAWVDTETKAGSRDLLPSEREVDGKILDYRRVCTEFTLFTPRKTAKTQLSAFIQFWFFMSGDVNAECLCAANAADQSKILFTRTRDLIHQLDPKEQHIRFTATQVNWRPGQFRSASLTALSAGGKTKDGLYAQLCSADEYGSAAYVNGSSDMGKLVSVIESSMGPRREPMTFISTTAGIISAGPFIDKLDGMERMLLQELDPNVKRTFAEDRQMCLLLQPDEWERKDTELLLRSKTIRQKINPMLGIVVQHSFYDDEVSKARQNPEKMNEVIAKLFNTYHAATIKEWLQPEEIRELQIDRRIDDCIDSEGWIVFAGLDFSKGDDLNGISYLAYNQDTGDFFADMDSYMSESAVNVNPIRELLKKWDSEGWLHIVPGKTFDPEVVVNRIIELNNKGVNFLGFGYDPFNAKVVLRSLGQWAFDIGMNPKDIIVPVRQQFATYNPAVAEFDYMVKRSTMGADGKPIPDPLIHFSRNPLWQYEFACVCLIESNDGMGNLKPWKRDASASCKVDNIQMLLSALIIYDSMEARINR